MPKSGPLTSTSALCFAYHGIHIHLKNMPLNFKKIRMSFKQCHLMVHDYLVLEQRRKVMSNDFLSVTLSSTG